MSSSTSSLTSDPLAVARVMGVRGLEGDLRVMVLSDAPHRLAVGAVLLVEGESAPRRILQVGTSKHGPVLRLEGVEDRDAASALVGSHLLSTEPPPVLPVGSYWWHELEGLQVVDTTGRGLGTLQEVFRAGSNEVYRVVGPEGEILVPALRSVVVEIDLPAGRMTIRDPSDWLEDA
ncbi:MAG: ribosome maturation factor RimM [Candidatus Limnocylindria bacterium]